MKIIYQVPYFYQLLKEDIEVLLQLTLGFNHSLPTVKPLFHSAISQPEQKRKTKPQTRHVNYVISYSEGFAEGGTWSYL